MFDGLEQTKVTIHGGKADLWLRGAGVRFAIEDPRGTEIQRTGDKIIHFNGLIEPFFAEVAGRKATFTLRALAADAG